LKGYHTPRWIAIAFGTAESVVLKVRAWVVSRHV